jgi:hypothetical protein
MVSKKCSRRKPYNPDKYGKARTQAEREALLADRLAERFRIIGDTNAPIDPDAVNTIELQMRSAVDAMTSGASKVEHAAVLAGEISKAMLICQADFAGAREYLAMVLKARDALESAGNRAMVKRKWGLSGPELCALRDFIDLRAALLSHEDYTKGLERSVDKAVRAEIEAGNVLRFAVDPEGVAA